MTRVPLVRTEGKLFTDGEPSLTPERFVSCAPLLVASRSNNAKQAEKEFGFGASLYFYAGHACPDFGDAVLVYEPELTEEYGGGATPFDTGGLYLGYIHAEGLSDGKSRRRYCQSHLIDLVDWRARLAEYLRTYFSSSSAYVLGEGPLKDDPTHRLQHPSNVRRAWTFEVRVDRDHPLLERLQMAFLEKDFFESVLQYLHDVEDTVRADWEERLGRKQIQGVGVGISVHTRAEQEIAQWPSSSGP